MSEEKGNDFVPYKYKDLKIYGSTEWLADGKKKYRRVFESSEAGYIYCEFSFYNKLFDEKRWTVKVNLKCFQLDGNGRRTNEICNINKDREVVESENVVYIREGWGNVSLGKFWRKGRYQWEASLDGRVVGNASFYVENRGVVSPISNPYFNLKSVKLFEGTNKVPTPQGRKYYTQFDKAQTRYVWSELALSNLTRDEDWWGEFVFNFYNDSRQLKGRTEELIHVLKGQAEIEIRSGWGSDHFGTWGKDNYTLEVVFMEQLVAVVPFVVADEFVEGEAQAVVPGTAGATLIQPGALPNEKNLEELMAEMDELIGLDSIKEKVKDYTQYLSFLKLRQEKGFEDPQRINLHAVFTGNPGTGKTTMAKLLGNIYHKMGLLEKGHVHEVDRSDLVGEFIGQTAPKVKEAIKNAAGGILFIDEAYALARSKQDQKDYGREVIEILLKEMSDGINGIAVLVAGYPEEMNTFLDSNPGLKSRFNMYYEFPDYLPQELREIANYATGKRGVTMTEEAKTLLYEKLVEAYRNRDVSFGNARLVNSIIDEAKMNMGLRVMRSKNVEELTEEDLSLIQLEDIEKIYGKSDKRKADIPIDQDLLNEAMTELHEMIGLDSVKSEIQELVKLVRFYREIGKDVMNTFSLHTIFTGNPGTGKTTVARILAKIYKALGILERGHIVECDRGGLVGGFLGQTAIKTAAVIDSAIGGVMFIDEAYALTQGSGNDYGRESVETILKRMEDQRGEFIVIAAGYPDNMNKFMESNPGLKSRFDKHLNFEDFKPEDLYEIAQLMLDKEDMAPDKDAEEHLKKFFKYCYDHKDRYFGNARTVRKVIEEAVKNHDLRLAGMNPEERTKDMLKVLTLEDVEEFHPDRDKLVGSGQNRIGFTLNRGEGQGQAPAQ